MSRSVLADLITQNVVNGCNSDNLQLFDDQAFFGAQFNVNSYECPTGYYLPADSLGCVQCLSGYECSGGIYDYNPTENQGIKLKSYILENVEQGCDYNLLFSERDEINIRPVFTPNTITLNWDYKDDTGRTAQTTCVYDTPITNVPDEPVRPGYKFMGWRVKPKE